MARNVKETSTLATLAEFGMPLSTGNEDRARTGPICVSPTNYLYDGENIVGRNDVNGSAVTRYMNGLNVDEPLTSLIGTDLEFYEADGLGSVTSSSNTAGSMSQTYTYDSFGNSSSTANSTSSPQYTSRESDPETGLYYYRARYYAANIGRFLEEDPIGFDAGPNFYRYVLNNPTRFTDPFGNDVWLEGPSGNEPTGHLSINVGDPNGNYQSYSFGANGDSWLGGEVYQDTSLGGKILPDYYLHYTRRRRASEGAARRPVG